ncbi:hypothetical protein CsSME_00016554 [Camellia sinensis var. sinensis]
MTQFFPPRWKKFWNEWEVRGMVLISLTTQVLLVILGNRRKHTAGIQVRVVVWSAYLLADSVATMAAGILSNRLGKVNVDGFIDPNVEITAFWAPLMLVHLGGTDAITAYSLEDNELWRRHSFQVVIQSMTTVYIFLMAWTGSLLSILFILMFVVGLFKYCERVCVLYLSTDNNFRDSIQDITTNESKIMKECKLKELEGYHVTTHQVLEVDQSIPNVENELLMAFGFLDMVKRLFADLIIGIRDGHTSRSIFDKISPDKAFKIIEIELGIIYDLRFTKAKCPDLKWSIVDLEFDQSILVWHLATEILYQYDKEFAGYDDLDKELEKGNWLSQYMLYLLVEHPYMLPLGMGHIKFQDIYYELGDIIEQQLKANKNIKISELLISKGSNHEKLFISNYKDTKLGGRSNLLILHGCKLASQLKTIDDTGTRWRFIVDIWIEMLGHAASQCRGRYHAQQLRRGGEFLTHVWLLMAHFGLNDLFQVRRGGTIADAILM